MLQITVVRSLRGLRDRARLARVSKRQFDSARLRPRSSGFRRKIFSDDAIKVKWKSDHSAISAVFASVDRLGGVNPGDRQAIYFLVCGLAPKRILEVGTHIGASTLYLARALKAIGGNGTVTTVDIFDVNDPVNGPWKQLGLAASPQSNADRLACDDRIRFVVRPALDFMADTDERFDLIFLDGDHSAQAVYKEVSASLPLLASGGLILLHDYYPGGRALFRDRNVITGPYLALRRIMAENRSISVLPLGDLPWPTKQGSHTTSLALVFRAEK